MRDNGTGSRRQGPGSLVWAVGGNSKGQLGHGITANSSFLPCKVAFELSPNQRVIEVFCGYEHTFALTSDGDVLGFGNGIKGQLGIGNTDSPSIPQRVHLLSGKGVVMMAAGLEHSLALTASGDLYAFGDNLSGQLGLGHNFTAKEQTPQKVPSLSRAKISQLACGQDHTAVLTSSGELYMFGNNRAGALGLAGHANEGPPIVASAPQLVTSLEGKRVVQIGCGLQHTVALTAGGSIYCWGENGRGQLGTGDTHNRFTPSLVCKPLSSSKCIHVACGGQHTIAVTDGDDVYGFGSDRHGQLGLGKRGVIVPFPSRIVRLGGRRVKNCIGGAWHTIIGTVTGEQYIMGCILPSANAPQAGAGGGAVSAAEAVGVRSGSKAMGAASATDPFALSCGEFRRLLLPRGAEACSKGHSLFYGQGLGAPPGALRKVVKSLGRLKADYSTMLLRQEPDVVFVPDRDARSSSVTAAPCFDRNVRGANAATSAAQSMTVGAHLAVLRARCPTLYEHAAESISRQQQQKKERTMEPDGGMTPWRVTPPTDVPLDALQLVICYLYQDAGVFEKQSSHNGAAENETADGKTTESGGASSQAAPSSSSVKPRVEGATTPSSSEPDRTRDRRDHIVSIRSRAGLSSADAEELSHGTAEMPLDPWGGGEHEAAAGFGSFGSAYGGSGKYDGAGLDRLVSLMAAARRLKLGRLQGLCEKRAEAFIDYRTVHKVLRRAAEGGFPYLKRRCLEFCLVHLGEVCAPGNSTEVVRELSKHPQVLADVLSLSAASDEAKAAAASEAPLEGAGSVPCIEVLGKETACPVPADDYEGDFLGLFESVVVTSVTGGEWEEEQHQPPPLSLGPTDAQAEEADGRQRRTQVETTQIRRGPVNSFAQARKQPLGDVDLAGAKVRPDYKKIGVNLPAEGEGDFKIRAGKGLPAVAAHRSILAARSGFFQALLYGSMGDPQREELTINMDLVVCMSALLEFLRFLYTGRSGVMEPLTALDLLYLTKGDKGSGGFFQVTGNDELRAFCTSTLFNGIDNDNALPILIRAKALGDEVVLEKVIEYILENFDGCMTSSRSRDGSDSGDDASGNDLGPACWENDESPAVDLLLALAQRCTVKMK